MDKRPIVNLPLNTRVPEKYLLVDRETGDVWQWFGSKWRNVRREYLSKPFDFQTIELKAIALQPIRDV